MSVIHNRHYHKLRCWWHEYSHRLSDAEYWETKQYVFGEPDGKQLAKLDDIVSKHSPYFAAERVKRSEQTKSTNKAANTLYAPPMASDAVKILLTDEHMENDELRRENKKLRAKIQALLSEREIMKTELSATYQRVNMFKRMLKNG